MAYQFVHIETYSDQPRKVRGTRNQWNSVRQVFLEAERHPDYSRHVDQPRDPFHISAHGAIPIAKLRELHDQKRREVTETVTQKNGKTYQRSLRKDAPTLYTEIHSHPMLTQDYHADPEKSREEILRWVDLAVKDFRERMPDGVVFSAVVHLDESHVHLHILAVNAEDPRLDANKLHAGKKAAADYRAAHAKPETLTSLPKPELDPRPKKPKKPRPSKNRQTQKKNKEKHELALANWEAECSRVEAKNAVKLETWKKENGQHLHDARKKRGGKNLEKAAYTEAMKAFQDSYYEAVGQPCGFLRHGPARERLSTKQYAARKAEAKARAQEQRDMATEKGSLNVEKAEVAEKTAEQKRKERELETRELALEQRAAQVTEREAHVAEREAALAVKNQEAETAMQASMEVRKEADALQLGLELIRRDQVHYVPQEGEQGGRLFVGPRGGPARPMPPRLQTRLNPAMSLLEILFKIIAEIIEDAIRARQAEIARDAAALAALRRSHDLPENPEITALFQRNDPGGGLEM